MSIKILRAPVFLAGALCLSACSSNYTGEGAGLGAAAGAGIAAVTGGDVLTGAAVGAAAGGVAGSFVDKDDKCDGYDRNGKLDDDCYGTEGYPVDPRRR